MNIISPSFDTILTRVKSGEQWIIGPTNFSLFFQLIFLKHFSLEPARILDFLASDSICRYQNRQTNLLNCMDLTQVKHTQLVPYAKLLFIYFTHISCCNNTCRQSNNSNTKYWRYHCNNSSNCSNRIDVSITNSR